MHGAYPIPLSTSRGEHQHTSTGTPLAVPDVPICRAITITGRNRLLLLRELVLNSHFAVVRSLIYTDFVRLRAITSQAGKESKA